MRTVSVFAFLAASALAQNAAPPAFEVASVRINQGEPFTGYKLDIAGDTLTIRNVPLRVIIAWAYNRQWPQVAGPSWIESARYDILAKAARPIPEDEARPLLQTLLAERFHLAFHRETRQTEAMAVTVPKGGHRMTPSKRDKVSVRQDPERGTVAEGVLLAELCENMTHDNGSIPVVDMTGLTGRFDFTLNMQKYREAMIARARSSAGPVNEGELRLTFMQDLFAGELGLRVDIRKAPVEFLVVDKADQKPAEN